MTDVRRPRGKAGRNLTHWGQVITCDHIKAESQGMSGTNGNNDAMTVKDVWSSYNMLYPLGDKTADEARYALLDFNGDRVVHIYYTDNSGELKQAIKDMGVPREGSLPGVPKTNGAIERTNRGVLDGARSLLVNAGLPGCFWEFAGPTYCHLDNIRVHEDGSSPWMSTHGEQFPGTSIPFGSAVIYHPSETKDLG